MCFSIFIYLCLVIWEYGILKISKISGVENQQIYGSGKVNKNSANSHQEKQITQLSNICYKPVSFGRTKAEHKSWGASVNPKTKEVSFKLFTYPDTKKVEVTIEKRDNPQKTKTYTLENKGQGVFETKSPLSPAEAAHGDKYYYTIYKGNGDIDRVKDPYSNRQEKLLGESTIYDHSLYNWNDADWYKNNKNRISRKANAQNGLSDVNSARIFEFNPETITKRGTLQSAQAIIKSISEAGFNAVEIMPVENTFSINWGYDGVDKMAPAEHLGGPDGLKSFVDYAHKNGINVIMDMVPNHLGPDGASLLKTGPYIKGSNCFGEAFNFEGENSRYVRDYMVNAALNWIENYHCDGLRLDMTKMMDSDTTMKQIAAEVNYHHPDAFLIAEDSRSSVNANEDGFYWEDPNEPHDKRIINPLKPFESGEGSTEEVHAQAIQQISDRNTSLGRIGFNSEWDFNFFHTLKDALYGVANMDELEKASYCSQDRVKYVMSHDEIGNFEGSRLIPKLMVPMLHLNDNMILNMVDYDRADALRAQKNISMESALNTVKLQKAQFTGEKLATMLEEGELDKYNTSNLTSPRWIREVNNAFRKDVLLPLGIKPSSGITYESIKTMYYRSFNKNKMAMARIFATPGPKMVFQGDERADLTPFRFFREFDSVKYEEYLYNEKGYEPGKKAMQDSQFGNILYSSEGRKNRSRFKNLIKDLNKLNMENPALTRGRLVPEDTVKHPYSQVFANHAVDGESRNEIYSITNFSPSAYPRSNATDYYIKFPKGKWAEVINTCDKKYGGTGKYNNTEIIESDGVNNVPVKLGGESTAIFKRVG